MFVRALPEGPFTWPMARDAGFSREEVTALLASHEIRRVLRNVYYATDVPDNVETRCAAAALIMKPHCVVRDRTASWLHTVDTFEFRELEILPPLEMSVLRGHSRVRRIGCDGNERDLASSDIMTIGQVKVTTPLRTSLDLGSTRGRRDALAALDGFMRVHDLTRQELTAELPRFRRRRGVVQLRELIPLADARSESPGESWTRLAILDDGLPAPLPQFWVLDRGVPRYRLDLPYPKHKVVVEYDGREFHDKPEQREADWKRRTWLREHGWTVIVVRAEDFRPERLAAWLGELRRALRLA
jgi:hypothetical protein